MPGPDGGLGKKAEKKIKEWLDHPESGYSFDRIPDQMSGRYLVSRNICDFICFKSPDMYYIESKATYNDRFDFSCISDLQREGLYAKASIDHVHGLIILLFASYQRAFIFNIKDITHAWRQGRKSINIKKIDSWNFPYVEISTIPSRKELLDYSGDLEEYVSKLG